MPLDFTGIDWANEDRKAQDGARRRLLSKKLKKCRRSYRRMTEQMEQVQRFLLWICANRESSSAMELLNFYTCTEFIKAAALVLPEITRGSSGNNAESIVLCLRYVKIWIRRGGSDGKRPLDLCAEWRREGIATEFYVEEEETEEKKVATKIPTISAKQVDRFSEAFSVLGDIVVGEIRDLRNVKAESDTDFRVVSFIFLFELDIAKQRAPALKPIFAALVNWYRQHDQIPESQVDMLNRLITRYDYVSSSSDDSPPRRTPPTTP